MWIWWVVPIQLQVLQILTKLTFICLSPCKRRFTIPYLKRSKRAVLPCGIFITNTIHSRVFYFSKHHQDTGHFHPLNWFNMANKWVIRHFLQYFFTLARTIDLKIGKLKIVANKAQVNYYLHFVFFYICIFFFTYIYPNWGNTVISYIFHFKINMAG